MKWKGRSKLVKISDYNIHEEILPFVDFICEKKDISIFNLLSKSRKREIVECRYWVFYFYTKYCIDNKKEPLTLEMIGSSIKKDHSTVLYGISVIQNLLDTNSVKRNELSTLYNQYLND
jgi:chromosomal replication initiation ATPase DnaA